jgi:tetratricopeptide (TPR) repeat protein
MVNLADALYLQGKYDAAEGMLRKVLDAFRRTQGPEHPRTLMVLADMALMYQLRGTFDLAEKNASAALTGRRHALGSTHPATMASAADLALALVSQGKYTDSESLAREAVEFTRKNQPDDWERYRAESLLGASLAGQQKFADAEPLLVDGYQGMLARKERMGVPNGYYLDRAGEWNPAVVSGLG